MAGARRGIDHLERRTRALGRRDKPEHAGKVVRRLMEDDMYSGWGAHAERKVAPVQSRLPYRNGLAHDNSIIAMGFKRYGYETELNELATGLFDAARAALLPAVGAVRRR
jgi:glycogen debranching enzyme